MHMNVANVMYLHRYKLTPSSVIAHTTVSHHTYVLTVCTYVCSPRVCTAHALYALVLMTVGIVFVPSTAVPADSPLLRNYTPGSDIARLEGTAHPGLHTFCSILCLNSTHRHT